MRKQRKATMRWKMVVSVAAALVLGWAGLAGAEDKASSSSVLPASALTPEQFKALPADAMIEIDGERMSKREFIERRRKALEQAVNKMQEMRAKAEVEFETRRKAFLDAEKAKLDEANKKVQAEAARLVAADAAAHRPNWEARKKEAAALLNEAATASASQRSQLEKKASDLLSSVSPQQ
jgi:hypothetical protein